jgi:hypothetical protein
VNSQVMVLEIDNDRQDLHKVSKELGEIVAGAGTFIPGIGLRGTCRPVASLLHRSCKETCKIKNRPVSLIYISVST